MRNVNVHAAWGQIARALIFIVALSPVAEGHAQSVFNSGLKPDSSIHFRADVIQKCPLSANELVGYVENLEAINRKMYELQKLPEARIKELLAGIKERTLNANKEQHYKIEYSCDGTNELYYQEVVEKKNDVFSDPSDKFFVLYDGVQSYKIRSDGLAVSVYKGRVDQRASWLPLPGASLPFDPIAKPPTSPTSPASAVAPSGYEPCLAASPLRADSDDGTFGYRPGYIKAVTVKDAPMVTDLYCAANGAKTEEWTFSDHSLIGANWYARKIEWAKFAKVGSGVTRAPILLRTVLIRDISTKSIRAGAFDLKKFVKKDAEVLDHQPNNQWVEYKYDPSKSWAEMRKGARSIFRAKHVTNLRETAVRPAVLPVAVRLGSSGFLLFWCIRD